MLQFEYLDMKPGDCMIMSKQSLHMSDPRPHLEGIPSNRRAFAMRIIIQNTTKGEEFLRFNPFHPYTYYGPLHSSLKEIALQGKELGNGVRQLKLNSQFDMFDPRGEWLTQIERPCASVSAYCMPCLRLC